MKAIVYDKKASPDKLVYKDVAKPEPGNNEVLVKIFAASLNAADYRTYKMGFPPKSRIFGSDIAGRVESTGKDVTEFIAGDKVMGDIASHGFGGLAEYVAVDEKALAPIPEGVSYTDAASLPLAGITALQALKNKGKISAGKKVLIVGSGGSVGNWAVQLASYFGAELTTVCGPGNTGLMESLGAEHIIDYKSDDFSKLGLKWDIILGVNGSHSLRKYRRCLNRQGVYVMVGGSFYQIFSALTFRGIMSAGSKRMTSLAAKANRDDLELLGKLLAEGKIKAVIDRQFRLEEGIDAMKYIMQGHAKGKVIIEIVN